MDKIPKSVVTSAIKAAIKSNGWAYRHGAVIYTNSKRILAIGSNQIYKTHPKSRSHLCTLHAEVSAICKAKSRYGRLNGYKIFVLRLNKIGELKLSKPCDGCMSLIKSEGLIPFWT